MNREQINNEISNFLDKTDIQNPYDRCCILSGPWGVGKSHLISEIQNRRKDVDYFINVSLFGLSNIVDLKSRILSEISRNFKGAAKVLKALVSSSTVQINLGLFALSFDLSKITEALSEKKIDNLIIRRAKSYVVVIDDIERKDFRLSVVEVLGAVDELLKNESFKVILITNFDKYSLEKECKEFKDFKEKIAGKTFELNENKDVAKSILKNDFSFIDRGSNLRTIIRFREIVDYIQQAKINYYQVIYKVIYYVLRCDKEKVDLLNAVKSKIVTNESLFVPQEFYREDEINHYSFRQLIVEYCLSKSDLMDDDKVFDRYQLRKIVYEVNQAISDGNMNQLLCLSKLDYKIYINVEPMVKAFEKTPDDEEAALNVLDNFRRAFEENTALHEESIVLFCNFLFENQARLSTSKKFEIRFKSTYNCFLSQTVDLIFETPEKHAVISDCLRRKAKQQSSNKWIQKMLNDIKRKVLDSLLVLKFNNDKYFSSSLSKFEQVPQSLIDSDFFQHFHNGNKSKIFEGISYIYEKCKKNVSDERWNYFVRYFKMINKMQLSTELKQEIRTLMKENNFAANKKMQDLMMYL